MLKREQSRVWEILEDIVRVYLKIHEHDIAHLDATSKNILIEKKSGTMKLFDFEFYAAPHISLELQKAYDIIRITEYSLRNLQKQYQDGYVPFVEFLDDVVPAEIRDVDFQPLEFCVKNIQRFPIYQPLQNRIFKKLLFRQDMAN